ncbi:MAG: hypothetical protein KDD83_05165 [Caldilineaceae bacterium]|nr:hypothetical protein [Caldilineaceae bacterium]
MDDRPRPQSATIFTLRLWYEALDEGSGEWRGELKNLVTGEVRYFRTWAEIAALVPRMLDERGMPRP